MIARVFPRRTSATPTDAYAFVGEPPKELPEDITEVHVSITFTWDLVEGDRLANLWSKVAPVKVGGVAFGQPSGAFTPGMYVKQGHTITSRGCPNHCWFCSVPKREGGLRELEVKAGSNILDDNLLACSTEHIKKVFDMLLPQRNVILSGGVEAKLLKPWHVELFQKVKVQRLYMAYDTPDDLPPLQAASQLFQEFPSWYRWWKACCYVLIGYPGDTLLAAEERLMTILKLGFTPYAMFYRDTEGKNIKTKEWSKLQRLWVKPQIIRTTRKSLYGNT